MLWDYLSVWDRHATITCLAWRILLDVYKVHTQVFLSAQGHCCFQRLRENLSTNHAYGKLCGLLSRCPMLCTFVPAVLCSLWNLDSMLEGGGFTNLRLGQCYLVEPVQLWPASSSCCLRVPSLGTLKSDSQGWAPSQYSCIPSGCCFLCSQAVFP